MKGIVGRKLGMTQVFDDSGTLHAVTVIEVTTQTVTQVKSTVRDGYDAFQLLDQSTVGQITDAATGQVFPAGSSGPFGGDLPGKWLSHADMVAFYSTTVRDLHGNRLAPRTQWWDIHCTYPGKCGNDERNV